MKKYIITGIMSVIAATSVMAGTPVASKEVVAIEDPCLFRDQELQIDAFGLGYFNQGGGNFNFNGQNASGVSGRPMWGGGLGINYFFSRYIGIGLEQDLFGRQSGQNNNLGDAGATRWATIGNLFLRYPICSWNLAPYVMLGGGAIYGNVPTLNTGNGTYKPAGQGVGHVGGGLEYRITQNIGLFSDARYMFSGVAGLPDNNLMWRYGLRFAF